MSIRPIRPIRPISSVERRKPSVERQARENRPSTLDPRPSPSDIARAIACVENQLGELKRLLALPAAGLPAPRWHAGKRLQAEVAAYFDVPLEKMSSPTRQQPAAWARQLAMELCFTGLGLTKAEVARLFQRDQETVDYARVTVRDRLTVDIEAARLHAALLKKFGRKKEDSPQRRGGAEKEKPNLW
jgi:hypothetical protein